MLMRSRTPKRSTCLYHVGASISPIDSSIGKQVNNVKNLLFDFNYNYQNEDFKNFFEKNFIEKYYTYNFADETFELFQLHLTQKTREVFKNYEKLLSFYFEENENDFIDKTTRIYEESGKNKNKNVGASLPIGIINTDNIGGVSYADNGNLNEGENSKKNKEIVEAYNNIFDKKIKNMTAFQDFFSKMLNEFQPLFSILL